MASKANSIVNIILKLENRVTSQANKIVSTFDKIQDKLKKIQDASQKIGDVSKKIAGIGIAITGAFAFPVAKAVTFQKNLADIQGLLTENSDATAKYQDELLDLGSAMGVSSNEMSTGSYQVISSIGQTGEEVGFLNEAIKLSVTALGSTTQAVDILSIAYQNYKNEISDVNKIAGYLNTIVTNGRTTLDQLSGTLGAVLGVAPKLGVGLDQVSAAMALLTRSLPTPVAATALKSLFNALIKQSGEFAKQGIDIVKVIGEQGLGGALKLLKENLGGDIVALREAIPDMKAFSAVMSLGGENLKEYNSLLGLTRTQVDDFDRLYQEKTGTMDAATKRLKASFESLQITIGDEFLPVLTKFANQASEGIKSLNEFTRSLGGIGKGAILGVAGFGVLLAAIGGLGLLISKIIAGLALFGSAVVSVSGVVTGLVGVMSSLGTVIGTGVIGMFGALAASIGGVAAGITLVVGAITILISAFLGLGLDKQVASWLGLKNITEIYYNTLNLIKIAWYETQVAAIKGLKAIHSAIGSNLTMYDKELEYLDQKINALQGQVRGVDQLSNAYKIQNDGVQASQILLEQLKTTTATYSKQVKELVNDEVLLKKNIDAKIESLEKLKNKTLEALQAEIKRKEESGNIAGILALDEQVTQVKEDFLKARSEMQRTYDEELIAIIKEGSDARFATEQANFLQQITYFAELYQQDKISYEQYLKEKNQLLSDFSANSQIIQKEYLEAGLNEDFYNNAIIYETDYREKQKVITEQSLQKILELEKGIVQAKEKLKQEEFEKFKIIEEAKLSSKKSYSTMSESIDQIAVANGELTQTEALQRQLENLRSYHEQKIALENETIRRIGETEGVKSAEYQKAIYERQSLDNEYFTKKAELSQQIKEVEKADLLDAQEFYKQVVNNNEKLSEGEVERKLAKLDKFHEQGLLKEQEYQDARAAITAEANDEIEADTVDSAEKTSKGTVAFTELMSKDAKAKMAGVFDKYTNYVVEAAELSYAKLYPVAGFVLYKLENTINDVRRSLASEGKDLTQSTSEEAKAILEGLTADYMKNLTHWGQEFAAWVEKIEKLSAELKNEVRSLEEQLLQMEGEYVQLADAWYEKARADLDAKYGDDLSKTEDYKKALETLDKIYANKRQEALDKMNEEERRKQDEHSNYINNSWGDVANNISGAADAAVSSINGVYSALLSSRQSGGGGGTTSGIGAGFTNALGQALSDTENLGNQVVTDNGVIKIEKKIISESNIEINNNFNTLTDEATEDFIINKFIPAYNNTLENIS